MLFQVCKLCGTTLPETEYLQNITIENSGIINNVNVCQRCYNVALNENRTKSRLLME